ncbi:diacylglycerol kinase kappa isoform X2 [Thamnophis elegans]|uniref:diacylglycerol kinase kappa isoform X2 n=1 Tax=Thamnophis elegans TaxID=35005 RepID=UPI00137807CA|nr:diacylglycerol kinase kappa isoform X2 [Thamnophis elegans]
MGEKLAPPGELFLRKGRESVVSLEMDRLAPGEESTDSEGEQEGGSHRLIRKVSTSGQMRAKKSVREGLLLKQTSSFQRWKRRFFKLRGRTLYYAKDAKSLIFDEVDLSDASVAETSTKNINNSFTVITPFRKLILCAENRKEMEDWIGALKSVQKWEINEVVLRGGPAGRARVGYLGFNLPISLGQIKVPETAQAEGGAGALSVTAAPNCCALLQASQFNMEHFSGMHNWYACSHARPTFCNVCREALSGVTSHGLSCEVCKFKAHKRCAVRATNSCKWTTLASIGNDIIEDEDGVAMPHQWLEGNLPVGARCAVCDKTSGSVRRLQDWRCLWCKTVVHSTCREQLGKKCPLGQYKVSIIPPTALNSIDSDGFWKATCPSSCSSPLLAFVNSKSGDNQGVKFLRKFKQFLNPAQVFDLMNGGPHLGLRLFQKFSTFRILVCGGDGSVGWVLSEIDSLGLHKQCQLGVLPLGTGNDLARVLGWGSLCDDDTQLMQVLEKLERATTKMLDRWSVLTYEAPKQSGPALEDDESENPTIQAQISHYADSVALHLAKILESDKHSVVISSAKFLCGTVNDFVADVGKAYGRAADNKQEAAIMAGKCATLSEKLDSLVRELNEESQATVVPEGHAAAPEVKEQSAIQPSLRPPRIFKSKEQLMLRANSLKKALRQIIDQAEKAVDEQNKQTQTYRSLSVASKKDSGEEINKEIEAPKSRRDTVTSTTSSLFLDQPEHFTPTPFSEDPDAVQFSERCVMNNYFGIGLDAKISLEFNNKRDEHPKKCSSRTKNMMWYGVLGTKELLQRTYKNLEQRVQLECDGVPISLPSLQGIAVLNIPSYAGGINFWGGTKEDSNFGAPSFDDKKLEVVAVFGSIQMAVSRVINLQHHRIAQCRMVKITIRGDEGVPVQVDGEAWIQPPGVIQIQHKNRAQMLTRDRAFESTLKSWEDKQKGEAYRAPSRLRLSSQQSMEYLMEEEATQMQQLVRATETLISRIREAAKSRKGMEQELAHAVNSSSLALSEVLACKSTSGAPEGELQLISRSTAVEVSVSVKALCTETQAFLDGKQLDSPQQEDALHQALDAVGQELQRFSDVHWMTPIMSSVEEVMGQEAPGSSNKGSLKLRINLAKPKKEKLQKQRSGGVTPVDSWGPEEVAAWLEALDLGEYKELFMRHDIQGSELMLLERRDLKELGISKVGHVKRILQGIKEPAGQQ